ncbi:MAG: hypothetical protein LBJ81_01410 [Puniceicoccales bacterium]|nr:hypothetical protein [Puniceicoccales bacterium]
MDELPTLDEVKALKARGLGMWKEVEVCVENDEDDPTQEKMKLAQHVAIMKNQAADRANGIGGETTDQREIAGEMSRQLENILTLLQGKNNNFIPR